MSHLNIILINVRVRLEVTGVANVVQTFFTVFGVNGMS